MLRLASGLSPVPAFFLKNSSHRSSAPPSSMRVPPPRPQRHALPPAPRLIPQLSHPTDRMPQPARDNRAWELLAAGFLRGSLTAARRLAASRSDASERNGPAPGCRCVPPPRAPTYSRLTAGPKFDIFVWFSEAEIAPSPRAPCRNRDCGRPRARLRPYEASYRTYGPPPTRRTGWRPRMTGSRGPKAPRLGFACRARCASGRKIHDLPAFAGS